MAGRRARWVFAVLTVAVSLVAFVPSSSARPAAPADHDETDECGHHDHGKCPPPPGESPAPTCELSADSGRVGDTIVATVDNVPAGTEVQLTFDGETMDSGVAPENGSMKLQAKVPDRANGSYRVALVGAGLALADCGTLGRVAVLGGGTTGDPPGKLALTGFQFWALLLVALALLVAGALIMRASRHRRRHVSSRATG
ncbi:MAG: hypothetical protein ACRD0U_11635 [Acidimicrobiales bacterium]